MSELKPGQRESKFSKDYRHDREREWITSTDEQITGCSCGHASSEHSFDHGPCEHYGCNCVAFDPLCSDCPPVGYPTDKTRCMDCSRIPEPCDHKNATEQDKVCPDCGGPES